MIKIKNPRFAQNICYDYQWFDTCSSFFGFVLKPAHNTHLDLIFYFSIFLYSISECNNLYCQKQKIRFFLFLTMWEFSKAPFWLPKECYTQIHSSVPRWPLVHVLHQISIVLRLISRCSKNAFPGSCSDQEIKMQFQTGMNYLRFYCLLQTLPNPLLVWPRFDHRENLH